MRRQKAFAATRNVNCKAVLGAIDADRWQKLRAKWEDRDAQHYHENYLKYFDLERWCPQAVVVAMQAGLTEGPRRRVLDIGCGSGLLLRVCKHFGHDVVGIDVGNPMFMGMCEALEVRCIADMILPGKRLPAELQGFDVITAVSPKFYRGEVIPGRPLDNVWNDEAWDFFLADLASRLHEDGFFFGKFNHNHELSPRMLERATRRQFVTEPGLRFVLPRGELT
ncbi:MAG TPA: methyltransferase domain-containing protein [Geminicoccaceae bacterium]|nr:methyltransferase domain-containing protein [Geminicoccus sp.]HMU52547.1 methyltransferase domain-containing protein [Geminicoccaceae bacterium]